MCCRIRRGENVGGGRERGSWMLWCWFLRDAMGLEALLLCSASFRIVV